MFIKDNYSNAFNYELKKFLKAIDPDKVPSNFTTFYFDNLENEIKELNDIKFNKNILHQSKLVNYFNGDFAKSKIEKDLNNYFKKIKKNKKYFFSTKDNILIESFISDGIKISEKYENMLELNKSNIPTDIEVMINDGEIAMILLRLVEIIGEDDLKDLGSETLYFIISTLNKLNIDKIRNDIILQVIPVKV